MPLDLFHLMSLVLAAGLGVDYALFFERSEGDRDERLRTLHGVLVSSVSTLMVFALLSLSSMPVLRSIGVTVTLGVVMNFRPRACPAARAGAAHVSTGIAVRDLVPHAGSMCLLEEVVAWDAQRATVITRSHTSPSNPLRRQARLSALCLCEYGAQAMAVHGALVAQAAGRALAPGLLVSLREVELAVTSIESLPGELRIQVERLAARQSAGFSIAFA